MKYEQGLWIVLMSISWVGYCVMVIDDVTSEGN